MFLIIFVLLLILAISYYYFNVVQPFSVLNAIPGPPRTFLLGNLPLFENGYKLTKQFIDWGTEYGSPLMLDMGTEKTVSVFDADQMEQILKANTNLNKNVDYRLLDDWLGTGLLTGDGDSKWHKRRKQLTPTFHFQILKDFIPIIAEQSAIFAEVIGDKSSNGATVDICPLLKAVTMDIICETAMGKQLNSQNGEIPAYATALNKVATLFLYRSMHPYLYPDVLWGMTAMGKEWKTSVQTMRQFTLDVIHERELAIQTGETGGKKKRLALLDSLLELKQKGEMTLDEVREETDTFMFAGHDTTSNGLSWALWCLASHKDVQEKVYEEICSELGNDQEIEFTMEAVNRLKYLDCVIKEAQRLLPSVAMVARKIDTGIDIGGYYVPPGTSLFLFFLMMHRDPKYFPDPLKYDPDRFLPQNITDRHAFAFTPFSAGPRNCIGQKFAMLEQKITLVTLVRKFQLDTKQTFDELKPNIELVMIPAEGIHLTFSRREE